MGLIANVVPNAPIASAWGNAIRDRTIQSFANPTERDSQWTAPPAGAFCITLDTGTLWKYFGGAWISMSSPRGIIANAASGVPVTNQKMPITTVIAGAASWLAANVITIPAGAGGLYAVNLDVQFVAQSVVWNSAELRTAAGVALGFSTSLIIATGNQAQNLHGGWLVPLADAATVSVYWLANPPTSGYVKRLSLWRVGDALATT